MDTAILGEFGLTKNEQKIFVTLNQKGTLSATGIAKSTGLNRPYVYYAVERLMEKGYLAQQTIRGTKHYTPVDLDQIRALEEHKIDALRGLLDELKKLQAKYREETHVEVLKGAHVVKNIFRKIMRDLKEGEEIVYLGLNEEIMESIEPIYLKKILNQFKRQKTTERIIIPEQSMPLEYAQTATYRTLPEEIFGSTAKIIYQGNIIELLYGNPVYAIVIGSKELAETGMKQFEIFWDIAKPLKTDRERA